LRRLGHDVISIQEIFPSLDDPPILDIAGNENRILITNDKDFGELIYRSRLPHAGVLLFRLQETSGRSISSVEGCSAAPLDQSGPIKTPSDGRIPFGYPNRIKALLSSGNPIPKHL